MHDPHHQHNLSIQSYQSLEVSHDNIEVKKNNLYPKLKIYLNHSAIKLNDFSHDLNISSHMFDDQEFKMAVEPSDAEDKEAQRLRESVAQKDEFGAYGEIKSVYRSQKAANRTGLGHRKTTAKGAGEVAFTV